MNRTTITLEKERVDTSTVLLPEEIDKKKQEIIMKARQSPEVQQILRTINVEDNGSLMKFGGESAEEIARFSDGILRSLNNTKMEDAGKLIVQLDKIMDKFDIKDFEKEPGFLAKLFNSAKNSVEAIFKKYHTMGDEVDKVFITLKQYEHEIDQNNQHLENMFNQNLDYYEQLQHYIVAGEMAVEELRTSIIPEWERKAEISLNGQDEIMVQNLHRAIDMMQQRILDLRMAENIALQSMPMIKSIQYGNYNLVRKINSAFVITLPIFKQSLANAIMLRRQSVHTKAMKALDDRTNEMLIKNANNTVLQTKLTTELASSSSIKIETLQQTWQTIMQGIEDTKKIQADATVKRIADTKQLEQFKEAFEQKQLR